MTDRKAKPFAVVPKRVVESDAFMDLPYRCRCDVLALYVSTHPWGRFPLTAGSYKRRTMSDGADGFRPRVDAIVKAGILEVIEVGGEEVGVFTGYDQDMPALLIKRRGDPPPGLFPKRSTKRRQTVDKASPSSRTDKTRPEQTREKREDARAPEVSDGPDEPPTPIDIGESWDGYSDIGPDPAGEPPDPFDAIRADVDAWLHAVANERTAANHDRMGLDHTQPGPMRALTRDLYPLLVALIEGTKPRAKTFPVDQIAAGMRRHAANVFNMSSPSDGTLVSSLIAQIRHARESAHREQRLESMVATKDPLEERLERVKAGSPYPETGKERAAFDNYCDEHAIGHFERQCLLDDAAKMKPIMVEIREKVQTLKALMAQRVQA